MFPGLDLYYTDSDQHIKMAGWDLDDLDRDVSDVCTVHVSLGNLPCAPPRQPAVPVATLVL